MVQATTTETRQRTTSRADKPEAESKTWGGVEPSHATNESNTGKKFFLVVCLKKY